MLDGDWRTKFKKPGERVIKNIELEYPQIGDNVSAIEIELCDVRASDGILVEYDFERDGWVILQPTKLEWEVGEDADPKWKESAFIPSWQYIRPS